MLRISAMRSIVSGTSSCALCAICAILWGMEDTPVTTGAALRSLRTAAGLTQEQVAVEAGVSPTHLSRVESGTKTATTAWLGLVAGAIARHLKKAA